MARQIVIQFVGDPSSLNRAAASAERSTGKVGNAMKGAAKAGAAGLAVAAAATGKALFDMGQEAADLNETISKTHVVFGDGPAKNLEKWASGAAKSMGQSKQTALDAASTFGMFGKMAGKSGMDLAGFAKENTQLAADLASFHNSTPEEAIEALGSAFRGEAEPIRKFGVLLDDATLKEEALKLGLIKTTKEALTPQQKVLAAQAAIMKQTKDAQGDFARTSGGLANQQRILKATFANLRLEVGAKVLPVMEKVVKWANTSMVPAMRQVAGWIKDNVVPAFKRFGGEGPGALAKIKAALAPVIKNFRGLVTAVVPIVRRIVSEIRKNWGPIKAYVRQHFGQVKVIIKDVIGVIAQIIRRVTQVIKFVWKNFGNDIIKVAKIAFKTVGGVISGAMKVIRGIVKTVLSLLKGDWRGAWDGIKTILSGAWKIIKTVVSGAIKAVWTIQKTILGYIWEKYKTVLGAVWKKVKDTFNDVLTKVRTTLNDVWTKVKTVFNDVWTKVKDKVGSVWTKVKDVFGSVWTKVKDTLNNVWTKVKTVFNDAWTKVKDKLGSVWTKVKTTFDNIWTKVKDKIGKVWTKFKDVFITGVPSAAKKAKEGFETWWKKLEGIAKKPVNFIIRTVYNNGIRKVVNAIPGVPDIGPIGTFARGGPVRGGIRGRDSVNALLMPDEHVLTTEEVEKAGGHKAIYRLREMIRTGEFTRIGDLGLPRFAEGGTFSDQQIANAQSFARAQVGKPYDLGGAGPIAYDCSGFMAAIANVLQGMYPYSRRGSTATFPWPGFKPGFGQFTIGSANPFPGSGMGHMAGTLGGMPVESYGGHGPSVSNRSASSAGFNEIYHLGSAGGGKGGGGGNWNPFGWVDDIKGFFTKIKGWIGDLGKMGGWGGLIKEMAKSVANAVVNKINGMVPGSPIPTFDRGGIWTGGHALNRSGQPERVLSPSQTRNFERLVNGSGSGITINFNVPIDPVAAGREVEKVLVKFQRHTGRPLAVRTV